EEMLAHIKVCMGGRAAEELVFGKQSTGAHGDFEQATLEAQQMVRFFGMSSELGPVVYDRGRFDYSQKTAELIDQEVKRICQECLAEVVKTLTENRDKLDLLAKTLFEKELLEA